MSGGFAMRAMGAIDRAASALKSLWVLAQAHPKKVALLAGLILPLAFAPFFLLPLFYLSYGVFIALWARTETIKAALGLGWWFGFGQFFVGLIWMGEAFLVEAERFLWALPFAITLLPAGLAVFPALAAGLAFFGRRRFALASVSAALLLALCLAMAAYARSTILTGLPWNLPAMGWASWLYLAQGVAYIGVHGLGLVALISAALLPLAGRARLVALALPLFAVCLSWVHLHARATPPATDTRLIVMQPNIAQRDKWRPESRDAHIDKTFRLTRMAVAQAPAADLVIWPETALPALIDEGPGFGERLRALYPAEMKKRPYLLTGAIRRELGATRTAFYNSAFLWSGEGYLLARSDKHHLVPFGEYLPLQDWLEALGLEQLTRLRGGYSAGPAHARLHAAGLPDMALLICYEAIFPPLAGGRPRPDVLINITNDGWFGNSIGPHQHLALARLRAIEQGLPLIRAANTGISAGFDARGRVLQKLALGETGSLSLQLPAALPPTVYARFGDKLFFGLCLFVMVVTGVMGARKRLRASQR